MLNILGETVDFFSILNLEPWNDLGKVLLIGEGNLSFSKSIFSNPMIKIDDMVSTTYEGCKSLFKETIKNSALLKLRGFKVYHGIDATKLNQKFQEYFDTIVFQFPNVGSRDAKYGQNPNHIMIRKFLDQAKGILTKNGKVLITVVDSPYYKGAFKFDDVSGYHKPKKFLFDPNKFIGYNHVNTNDEDSALDKHRRFITYFFRPL